MPSPPSPPNSQGDHISDFYDYLPSVGWNAFFMAAFYVLALALAWRVVRQRTWITLVPLFFVASEAGGYTARLLLAQNNGAIRNKFLAEYITLILAPNIAQAFLYGITSGLLRAAPLRKFFLTKRSWLLPTFFIVADLICLSIQAIGGAQEANNNSTTSNSKRKRAGTIVLTGLAAQLAFLALFLLIFLWVTAKLVVVSRKAATAHRRIVKLVVGVVAAVCLVTARNCYRVADFSQNLKKDHTALGAKEVYYFSGDAILMLLTGIIFVLFYLEERSTYEDIAAWRDQLGEGSPQPADTMARSDSPSMVSTKSATAPDNQV